MQNVQHGDLLHVERAAGGRPAQTFPPSALTWPSKHADAAFVHAALRVILHLELASSSAKACIFRNHNLP